MREPKEGSYIVHQETEPFVNDLTPPLLHKQTHQVNSRVNIKTVNVNKGELWTCSGPSGARKKEEWPVRRSNQEKQEVRRNARR